jgi:membrane-associated phospholipid phosphatase
MRVTFIIFLLFCSNFLNAQNKYFALANAGKNSSFFNYSVQNSLLKDSVLSLQNLDFRGKYPSKVWLKAAIVPAGLVSAGLITMAVPENTWFSKYSVKERIHNHWPNFSTKVDNYLQFTPGVAVFALKFSGVRSRSDLLNQGIILVKSQLLQAAIVSSLKEITHIRRPNGEGYKSMPSGHTAESFQLATMLDMEYRDVSPWISVGGYAAASATGALRMLNNKHWDSDVLVGAGLGILSTKIVYLTHQYRWKQHSKTVFLPAIYPKGGGVVFAMEL